MFKDFGRRLQRDVNKLINNRIKEASFFAGNNLKAEPMKVEVNIKLIIINYYLFNKVISHRMQRYAVWFGGSLFANLPDFSKCVKTKLR